MDQFTDGGNLFAGSQQPLQTGYLAGAAGTQIVQSPIHCFLQRFSAINRRLSKSHAVLRLEEAKICPEIPNLRKLFR
jgi:hypothetical protein